MKGVMSLTIITSDRFSEHQTPPGHPESPERAAVMARVVEAWRKRGGEVAEPPPATLEQLGRVHGEAYLRRIASLSGQAVALDPDTYTSPETSDVAALAAGAAVEAVERVLGGRTERALAVVRPPGHHAEHDRAMGFCFYNNVAVAAAHARSLGAGKVAIIDYDVHHGNGTQHTFEADPNVLYVSIHQFPYYPGTGAAGEIGRGSGRGFTMNAALEVGAVDEDYRVVFADAVLPVLRQFGPDLVLVSAGFDAHERDPLAGMRLSTAAFAAMTTELCLAADALCEGRLVALTEGGYDLRALHDSLQAVVSVLSAETIDGASWPAGGAVAASRGRTAVANIRAALGGFWDLS
jgi:acetoin utilization deacetylase AcuC-like enzyme